MRIIISNDIKQLTGQGIELLTDTNGDVLAEFYNGNICGACPRGNNEETITMKEAV